MLPKQVVFNADDFGLSAAVNAAVIRAHREGVLTSASLMANMNGFDEGVAMAGAEPTLGVGVHLNCLRGRPILPASRVASFLNPRGQFLDSVPQLAWRIATGRVRWAEIEHEWQAQIDRVRAAGITPTHLDSEKHCHLIFPPLTHIAAQLAVRNQIPVVRTVQESMASLDCRQRYRWQSWKCRLLNAQSRRARSLLRALSVHTPTFFYGITATGRMTVAYVQQILKQLAPGVTECMFHPAIAVDDATLRRSFLQAQRRMEFETLCAPAVRACCAEQGIQLIHYGASL